MYYKSDSSFDKLTETYAGRHDLIGGQLFFYDELGNGKRDLTKQQSFWIDRASEMAVMIPIVGDAKSFAEVKTGSDSFFAVVGVIPLVGDGAKELRAAHKAYEEAKAVGDVAKMKESVESFAKAMPSSVKAEKATRPTALYNPKQTREMLEQASGKENIKSTTVVVNPRTSASDRLLPSGEKVVVINSENGKAVKVYSTPNELGERKLLANIPYDQRGLPIFDDVSAFTTKIEKPSNYENMSSRSRKLAEMKNATLALKNAINTGKVNRNIFNEEQLLDINKGNPTIAEYSWHHNAQSAPNNIQLVPRQIHKAVQHIGEGALSEGG